MKRKLISCLILGFLALAAGIDPVVGQFPERPLRIVLPFGAGRNGDITARVLAERMKDILNQNVLVENLPGPGGMAAARATLSAPRDGHTLPIADIALAGQGLVPQTIDQLPRPFLGRPGLVTALLSRGRALI